MTLLEEQQSDLANSTTEASTTVAGGAIVKVDLVVNRTGDYNDESAVDETASHSGGKSRSIMTKDISNSEDIEGSSLPTTSELSSSVLVGEQGSSSYNGDVMAMKRPTSTDSMTQQSQAQVHGTSSSSSLKPVKLNASNSRAKVELFIL